MRTRYVTFRHFQVLSIIPASFYSPSTCMTWTAVVVSVRVLDTVVCRLRREAGHGPPDVRSGVHYSKASATLRFNGVDSYANF